MGVTRDNYNTNKLITRRIGTTFFGCHSYSLNLAMQES